MLFENIYTQYFQIKNQAASTQQKKEDVQLQYIVVRVANSMVFSLVKIKKTHGAPQCAMTGDKKWQSEKYTMMTKTPMLRTKTMMLRRVIQRQFCGDPH
jgi:hypothetical protein